MIGALLCRAGWHDADPDGRWNGGYCFTRCRRCGRDMVRSAFGEWHVPKGYRVVWGPPGSVADLNQVLAENRTATVAAPLPPVADLNQVLAENRTATVAAPLPPVAPPPPSRLRRSATGGERSPFDFGDFDQAEAPASDGGDPFALPPELRRRAPPA